jgi:hypothetical protein
MPLGTESARNQLSFEVSLVNKSQAISMAVALPSMLAGCS